MSVICPSLNCKIASRQRTEKKQDFEKDKYKRKKRSRKKKKEKGKNMHALILTTMIFAAIVAVSSLCSLISAKY